MKAVINSQSSTPDRERGAAKIVVLVLVLAGLGSAVYFLPMRRYALDVLTWTESLGPWGPAAVGAFYIVACVLFIPGSVITLGAGALFGLWKGFIAVWIGSNLGAIAAFLVGRTIARDWVARKVAEYPRFAAIDEAVGRESFKIILLLRLSPIFPFNFLNYALGLTKASVGSFALASFIGMIPGTLMYVYLGSAARNITQVAAGEVQRGTAGRVLFWVGLAATVVVAVLVTRVARRALALEQARAKAETAEKPTEHKEPGPAPAAEALGVVRPEDQYNQELVKNVHPPERSNPEPAEKYNLVVIGAGTAGLVTAAGAAGLGAKVALVERHLMGGDCLNVGCVPSKALIRAARVMEEVRQAADFGVNVPSDVDVDFGAVMERMRRLRARISAHDSVERFTGLGVDVFLGQARFTDPHTVDVNGKTLRFVKAVIATGARAVTPKTKGLVDAGFLTNETVFSLTERPEKLAVIGGGPIGCELAQTFQRLGSEVILFHRGDHILDREDRDAAEIVQKRFIENGIMLVLNADIQEVETRDHEKIVHYAENGTVRSVGVNEILVGAGRAPNVEGLDLEAAGVAYDTRAGVIVNDNLQTTNPDIYAAGDICMKHKFTHAADAAARIVIQNALFKGSKKLSALTVPWCTYTSPEIAHVGMYEHEARDQGIEVRTFVRNLSDVDRAILDGEEDGFVKIHLGKGKDTILGATITASHAGDMISEISAAMAGGVGLGKLASVIHPYPTQAEAIKQTADEYNRTRLTPFVKKLFTKWLQWSRR